MPIHKIIQIARQFSYPANEKAVILDRNMLKILKSSYGIDVYELRSNSEYEVYDILATNSGIGQIGHQDEEGEGIIAFVVIIKKGVSEMQARKTLPAVSFGRRRSLFGNKYNQLN